ncbi:WD40 repeat domain-containing protein [Thermosulfuriphilus sp.]
MTRMLIVIAILAFIPVRIGQGEDFIPKVPGLSLAFRIGLEDVSFYVRAGHPPDVFLTFSPTGDLLAIGTFLGRIMVVSTRDGKILWQKRIPEAMVKRVAFSPDGQIIYYGEQGPDGFIYAARAENGQPLWQFRLADDLLPGTPPEKGDIYGIYRQPGCYRLKVLKNGDLLVLGIHSWMDKVKGYWRRLSRIYRLSPEGRLRWAWPQGGPAELSLIYADSDPQGKLIALVSTMASDRLPADHPYTPETFYVLDGERGREIGRYRIPPLNPSMTESRFGNQWLFLPRETLP